jgi:T-complex protein 1 subunit beta
MAEQAVLHAGGSVDKGEGARMSSFVGAIAIAVRGAGAAPARASLARRRAPPCLPCPLLPPAYQHARARCPQDLVKTTLGPKGMDKILQSISTPNGDIQVTNDGATILRSIIVDNPCAKVGGGQGGVLRTSAKLCAPLPRPFCAYRVCACAASCPCARVAIAPLLFPP